MRNKIVYRQHVYINRYRYIIILLHIDSINMERSHTGMNPDCDLAFSGTNLVSNN